MSFATSSSDRLDIAVQLLSGCVRGIVVAFKSADPAVALELHVKVAFDMAEMILREDDRRHREEIKSMEADNC